MPDAPSPHHATDRHAGFRGRIGVARADITPPAGIAARMWGAAKHDVAEGVHLPLTCTALALLGDDGRPLVLVALDLGWWRDAADERSVREPVLAALGLPPERLVVSLSHTHAGPAICRADAGLPGGHLIDGYLTRVTAAAVDTARRAVEDARPGVLEWTVGRCALARHRDLPDPSRPRVVCGFDPATPADDTLLVGRATADDGAPIATVLNYACHPTTLAWENRLISPDWVGAARGTVEAATAAPCLFLQGCSGDLAPRDQYGGDPAQADANGRQVGLAALTALAGMHPPAMALAFDGVVESGAPLAVWRRRPHAHATTLAASRVIVPLALKADLPTAAEIAVRLATAGDRVTAERLRRASGVRIAVGDGPDSPQAAWIWVIGDAVLVAQPNEGYSDLQRELRRRLAPTPVAVLNLANGASVGYLPPRTRYHGEIYQVWQTPFAAGCLERVVDACADEATRLLEAHAERAAAASG